MTIKEVEARTGMTRANIRFYETEGLISPARGENGYRDYSEQDVELLLRVKLLRGLGMSIEDIKAVRSGERELDTALAIRLEELNREEGHIQRSQAVCRELKAAGITFDTLDARHYLELLEQMDPAVIRQDVLPRVKAPWRRYFARGFDLQIYTLLVALVEVFILRLDVMGLMDSNDWSLFSLVHGVLPLVIAAAVEPLLLSRFGTTPGKWLQGLYITDMEDQNLTIREASVRTLSVIWHGLGWNIPIYSTICEWRSLGKCEAGEELPWEETSVLHMKRPRLWRAVLLAVGYIALLAVSVALVLTPVNDRIPNKGDLTLAQFCENYNALAEETGVGWMDVRLDSQGRWIYLDSTSENSYIVVTQEHYMYKLLPELEFDLENDILKRVSFYWSVYTEEAGEIANDIPDFHEEMRLIAWSFACARTERGSLSEAWDEIEACTEDEARYTGFSLSVEDAVVYSSVEYSGYTRKDLRGLFPGLTEWELVTEKDAPYYSCELEFSVFCP